MNEADVWKTILGYAVYVVPAVFLLVVTLANIFVVRQQTERNIERFGKYTRTVQAGLRIKVPFIDAKGPEISLKVQQLVLEADTKTEDDTVLKVKLAIQFQVTDSKAAQYESNDPIANMKSFALDVVRSYVPDQKLTDLYKNKEQLAQQAKQVVGDKMKAYGYAVRDVQVVDIELPASVQAAMNNVVEQQRLRQAAEQKGEGDKILVIKAAEAKRDQDKLHGEGIALQREAIAGGVEHSIERIKKATGLDGPGATAFLALMQYLDTLKDVGNNAKHVVFMPSGPSAVGNLTQEILGTLSAAGAESNGSKTAPAPVAVASR